MDFGVNTKLVEEYYNKSQKGYNWLYFDKKSLGMHHGFWYPWTENEDDALINQYKKIINMLRPKSGEIILDAGCGVGGGLYLADRKHKCEVHGNNAL